MMKLAISNIAWNVSDEEAVAAALQAEGVSSVEVAPAKVHPSPLECTPRDVARYREWWAARGISIVAMQALLFGRPDLQIFGDAGKRAETLAFLYRMIDIGSGLGAETLVFGSPKNRLVGDLPADAARTIELEFFGKAGDYAARHGVRFCVEANPEGYGADYVRNLPEVIDFLGRNPSAGLALHIDSGAMTMQDESPALLKSLERGIQHFHISEPHLVATGTGGTDHAAFAAALRDIQYDRSISIEMRPPSDGTPAVEHALAAVRYARGVYTSEI